MAARINLVTFKLSDSDLREVVCGAPNVRVGMRTAYAPIGTTLRGGFTLEPKKIRGVLSNGTSIGLRFFYSFEIQVAEFLLQQCLEMTFLRHLILFCLIFSKNVSSG